MLRHLYTALRDRGGDEYDVIKQDSLSSLA